MVRRACLRSERVQGDLYRADIGVRRYDQRPLERVPAAVEGEDRDGDQCLDGNGEYDRPEEADVPRAIDDRRVVQLIWHRKELLPQQEDRDSGCEEREDLRLIRVVETE